ncbi:MAG: hypothetical protein A2284_17305 [Deltaproteobacteria bacterium RIFOXYA12_FULL_61_11]|nr:MAG: hypothetical protein A2284_17305 [Deltaproteobacteria bacterium RIFOXYA12_FULL_61_11]
MTILFREDGTCSFLYDPESEDLVHLNPTATYIWQHLQRGWSRGRILEGLLSSFANPPPRSEVEHTMQEFFDFLEHQGLYRSPEEGAPR